MNRRQFLQVSGAGLAGVVAAGARLTPAVADGVTDLGVGTYTDGSVGNQISNFSITPVLVSCGVGTVAMGQFSGPFAMLMYSIEITSFQVDRAKGEIVARGTMRSITKVAGSTVEDVEHEFLAAALDNRGQGPDRFDVHFATPFWNPSNPMATPSDRVAEAVRFGGEIVADLGDVNVAP